MFALVYRARSPKALALGVAAAALVAFCFLTTMHERYAYAVLAFLPLAFPDRRVLAVDVAFGILYTMNLLAAAPPTAEIGAMFPVGGALGVAGSVLMLGVLGVDLPVPPRGGPRGPRARPAANPTPSNPPGRRPPRRRRGRRMTAVTSTDRTGLAGLARQPAPRPARPGRPRDDRRARDPLDPVRLRPAVADQPGVRARLPLARRRGPAAARHRHAVLAVADRRAVRDQRRRDPLPADRVPPVHPVHLAAGRPVVGRPDRDHGAVAWRSIGRRSGPGR